MKTPLLAFQSKGIYCAAGDFYIDPWQPVDRAVITHAHSDHARTGMKAYLAHEDAIPVLQYRLGSDITIQGLAYNAPITINGVQVSLHPAGHIIGSAQVRVEHKGEVWVVSGDYKTTPDRTCQPFEPVACHHFVTESTFGLPVFHWPNEKLVFEAINTWWLDCKQARKNAVIFAYSLGKAQRIIQGLDLSIGSVFCHGAIENTNDVLRQQGIALQATHRILPEHTKADFEGALIIAPPGAHASTWMKRFGEHETGFASGWMQLRGMRRRQNFDRGFVLSDHADWNGLLEAVRATGAEHVHVTHGYSDIFARYLNEQGIAASPVVTAYGQEDTDQLEAEAL
jgi:putative mRNA 3-end processing factor